MQSIVVGFGNGGRMRTLESGMPWPCDAACSSLAR
jgi:hypothetical protein